MVVDENGLRNYNISIKGKIDYHNQEITKLLDALNAFKKITLKEDGTLPIDPDVGQLISQARRNEVYDACEPVVRRLLGLDEATE